MFASVEIEPAPVATSRALGCVGVDIDVDHLAVADVDRFGNVVHARRIELPTRGKSSNQAQAIAGDVVAKVVALAQGGPKPLAIERLDPAEEGRVGGGGRGARGCCRPSPRWSPASSRQLCAPAWRSSRLTRRSLPSLAR